jgi:hypothetical protein
MIRHEMFWINYDSSQRLCRVNINVPKCVRKHNAILASTLDFGQALDLLEMDTGLEWREAEVRSLDFAVTWPSTISVDQMESVLKIRKGYRLDHGSQEDNNTIYLNPTSEEGLLQLVVYNKSKQLQAKGQSYVLPSIVGLEGRDLIRVEMRMLRRIRKQLYKKGLWNFNSILARDLETSAAFSGLIRLLESVVKGFLFSTTKGSKGNAEQQVLTALYLENPALVRRHLEGAPKLLTILESRQKIELKRRVIDEVKGSIASVKKSFEVSISPTRLAA